MPEYRFLISDGSGAVIAFLSFDATNDRAALEHPKPHLSAGCGVEIWCGSRRVDDESQQRDPGKRSCGGMR